LPTANRGGLGMPVAASGAVERGERRRKRRVRFRRRALRSCRARPRSGDTIGGPKRGSSR
jgi:hypothetical protein